ncbi:histidine kinase, partial [Chitinophaga sp.]|uniref:sensor histidine kinase n=1 Tax=Chitinophaga sp. TaxID=1869181 RepID=UPI00262C850D
PAPSFFPGTAVTLTILFFLTGALVAGAFWWRERRMRHRMQDQFLLQGGKASLELHTIQTQMNPHFIYNSLNAIHSFILSSSTDLASSYLTRFSRLMRMTLEHSSREWITLEEDLETLDLYLQLESLRFEGQFDYDIRLLPGHPPLNVLIPPFLIQPYVQNAIWNRLLQREGGKGCIKIEVGRNEEGMFVRLEDNGIARHNAFHQHQQKTPAIAVAGERLHWINHRYHTHANITSGHKYDEHHQRTGTYTLFRLPDVRYDEVAPETRIFK